MSAKTLSIIAYLTIIGWAVAYFNFIKSEKSGLLQYHLKQSLGLFMLSLLYIIVVKVVAIISTSIAGTLAWADILLFILMMLGVINALNVTKRPIPLIGKFFENKFFFIK